MSFFGINIKKIRKLKSLSQKELADVIDLKRATLGAYEEGRSEPKIDTIIRVANYFSISIDDLLKRELTINELLKFDTKLTTDERKLRKNFPRIPIITKDITKDYLQYHHKDSFIENMPYVEWPLKHEDKKYRAYEIQDLEMSDQEGGVYPEDIILVEKINLKDIKEEKPALVVYGELKFRTVATKGDKVYLKASHPAIEDIILSAKDIKEIWVLVGVFQKYRDFVSSGVKKKGNI